LFYSYLSSLSLSQGDGSGTASTWASVSPDFAAVGGEQTLFLYAVAFASPVVKIYNELLPRPQQIKSGWNAPKKFSVF
jgi:hypothetical protein